MNVLVTGGAGFIGSHLVEELVNHNHDVTVIDDLSEGKLKNLRKVEKKISFFEKNICQILYDDNYDVVYHLAAKHSVPKSFLTPDVYYDVNIKGTQRIVDVYGKTARIVNISSSSAYYANSPYAISKLAGEKMVGMADNACSVRLFNVFGERQPKLGALTPEVCHSILHDKQPIIYGSGLQRRDFTYVGDVVKEIIEYGEGAYCKWKDVYGIGYKENHTIDEVVEKIKKLLKVKVETLYTQARQGDVPQSEGTRDCHQYFGFEKGLEKTVKWYKKEFG